MRQNLRQTFPPTGFIELRPLLLILGGCVVALCFVLVMQTTRSSKSAVSQKDAQVTASTPPQPINKPRRQAARSKVRNEGSAAPIPARASSGSVMNPNEVPSAEADQNTPMLNVMTDSTPVFRSNSANSPIVTSLKRGDKVRSGGLQIIDSQGTWTLVRGNGRSGFVPSELLAEKTP